MQKKKKDKRWVRFRHRVFRNILFLFFTPYCRLRYGIKIEKFKEQEKRPYLILLNHQTPFDPFFVGISFKRPVYYLATEDIFSLGWVSSIIRYLVAPIAIKKQTTDVRAILNCIRVSREGGTICIAPEGNRTYSGRTEYMSPSIVPLARKLGMPIALYRIEGGYGAQPRWSDVIRKGSMRGYVSRLIQPEDYANMSDDELFLAISNELYVDEANADASFKHKRLAEYLERAVYVCPFCGLSKFESNKDIIECTTCHKKIRYMPDKRLVGEGFEFPFEFVAQWYDYQSDFVNDLDVLEYKEEPMFTDTADISEVIPCVKKQPLFKGASLSLYGDHLVISAGSETLSFPYEDTTAITVLGKNKANVYYGGKIYQIKGDKRFNALKYVHMYHRHNNIIKGEENVKFLGL